MIRILSYNASQVEEISRTDLAARWAAPAGRFWLNGAAPAMDELAWLQEAIQLEPAHVATVGEGHPTGYLLRLPRYLFGATTLVGMHEGRVSPLPLFFFLGRRFLITLHDGTSTQLATTWDAYQRQPELWRFGCDHLLGTLIDGMTQSYVNTARVLDQTLAPLRQKGAWSVRQRHIRAAMQTALQFGELRLQAQQQAAMLTALAHADHEALDANVCARLTQPAFQVAAVAAVAESGDAAARLLREQGVAGVGTQRSTLLLLLLVGILTLLLLQVVGIV
jgi:Mg2+ and Co2+ transporter CorA